MMLATATAFESNSIGDVLTQWEAAGFFTYIIPFLLIFALVFGILSRMKIFPEKKSISAIIALAVALMALQFPMVSEFFRELFPRLGIGLGIILLLLIAIGMFMKPDTGLPYLVGFLVFIVVLVKTFGAVGWATGAYWDDHWPLIIGVVFVLIVISMVVTDKEKDKKKSVLEKMLESAGDD